ncbi:MAG: transcriptional repressor [Clostridia bacterium]|nr:transcriptional repressor [Clostridia bacterium]
MPWKQSEETGMWQKERVIQELRSQGKRMTRQRMVLLDVILSGKWNCCKEIYYEASKRDAAIGMATVYRMVSTLEEIGVFSRCYRYSLPDHPCLEDRSGDWPD